MARKNLTHEGIIDATLKLIEEKGSLSKVNFREIAREMGCAHTSLYNLFPSYDDLIHETAKTLMTRMRSELTEKSKALVANGTYSSAVEAYIFCVAKYALEHRGWYRFLWMDYFEVNLGAFFKDQPRPEQLLLALYLEQCDYRITPEEAKIRLSIGHGFLHGEICKYLSQRNLATDEEVFIETLLTHVKWLLNYNLL